MQQVKPGWVRAAQHHGTAVLVAAVGAVPTTWMATMIDRTFHWYTILLITAFLATIAIYWSSFIGWIWKLSSDKKLKWFLSICGALLVVVWLGWPWARVQSVFRPVGGENKVIIENWIDQGDAEKLVLEKLQQATLGKPILLKAMRSLLVNNGRDFRIKRSKDTAWKKISFHGELCKVIGISGYDGSFDLEDSTGYMIQYPAEYIYFRDWVAWYKQ